MKATEQPIDTGTAAGKACLDMLGVLAEFETNLRRERRFEGISAAKARGMYKGRKPSIDAVEILRLRREDAEAAVHAAGGRVVLVDLVDSHSTTAAITRLRASHPRASDAAG